ncbi:MAG: GerMN domain-containing protein [Frankiales bacterium]|nr:GerMN domain-containing protein [Frankiales bacterium]
MPRRTRLAAATVAVCCLASCAGIPDGGTVHVGRQLTVGGSLGDIDFRVLPAAPQRGATPSDIVRGFLRAMVDSDGSYAVARSYLTARAAQQWHADTSLTTYDDSALQITAAAGPESSRVVRFVAPRVGVLDPRGDFTPRAGAIHTSFTLVRAVDGWRIDRLAPGALLSTTDATRSFGFANVYYVNRSGTVLVPEQILLRPQPQGFTTALLRSLLSGPGGWLAPAVRTGFPAGTELLGNVPVDPNGAAEVNLSNSVRQATPAQLRELSAQLVWTLRQVSEITTVRLFADGSPLPVPGVPPSQPRDAWQAFDPAAAPAAHAAFYAGPHGWRTNGGDVRGLGAFRGATMLAVSRTGSRVAAVRPGRGGATLLVAGGSGPASARLHADALTKPTFDRAGDVFTVVTRGGRSWVAEVPISGPVHRVPLDGSLLSGPVQELRLSRDGARIAVIAGPPGAGRLLMGRPSWPHGVLRFGAFRVVLPGVADVRGVAWDGADQVVVTVANSAGGRELRAVDANGYTSRTLSTAGLAANPIDVAAAPGEPTLVTAGHAVWLDDPSGGWVRLGRGSEPGYPG